MEIQLVTYLIWTLRIVLPIILFCVYFKLKDEPQAGPTDNTHSRETILARRKATLGAAVPQRIGGGTTKITMGLRPEEEGDRRGGKGGRRVGNNEARAAASREKRERAENDTKKATEESRDESVAEEPKIDINEERILVDASQDDEMYLEALLNYVAFTRREQQRVFLPELHGAPPPPPPKSSGGATSSRIGGATADQANAHSHLVLRGALRVERSDVAKHLYEHLMEEQVEVSPSTLELMLESCLRCKDVKGASDFLIRMETAGHMPDSGMLDRVMELHSEEKDARQREKVAKALPRDSVHLFENVAAEEALLDVDGARTKLCPTAAVFVPSFIPRPPSSAPPHDSISHGTEDLPQLTKLTAASRPFEPKFSMTFDPYMYTWTDSEALEVEKGHNGKGWEKGKRKDQHEEGSWKGKGKGAGYSDGKNWNAGGKDNQWSSKASWSSDAQWFSNEQWTAEADWRYGTKAPGKKVWVEKQSAKEVTDDGDKRDGKKSGGKVWKPKAESSEASAAASPAND